MKTLKVRPTKTVRMRVFVSWACNENGLNMLALEEDQARHSGKFSLLM